MNNVQTLDPDYHIDASEALGDISAMTANNQNNFAKLTQSNAILSGSNIRILNKMAALRKMMSTLAQQITTIEENNNNDRGGRRRNQKNRTLPTTSSRILLVAHIVKTWQSRINQEKFWAY